MQINSFFSSDSSARFFDQFLIKNNKNAELKKKPRSNEELIVQQAKTDKKMDIYTDS